MTPQLLAALRAAGLGISQHRYTPRADEWFAGGVGPDGNAYGEVGPFHSPEAALVAGVRWQRRVHDELRDEAVELHAMMLQAEQRAADAVEEVERLRKALKAAQAELRAEREAKG